LFLEVVIDTDCDNRSFVFGIDAFEIKVFRGEITVANIG